MGVGKAAPGSVTVARVCRRWEQARRGSRAELGTQEMLNPIQSLLSTPARQPPWASTQQRLARGNTNGPLSPLQLTGADTSLSLPPPHTGL